jgi:hypothetical protein
VHSRRAVPTQRSAKAFALAAFTGHLMTSVPVEAKTASKEAVNLESRSLTKNLKERPFSSQSLTRSRATWAARAPSGCLVTPRTCTALLLTSMAKSTYGWVSHTGSTTKKSTAKVPAAWARRNSAPPCPRRGAGPAQDAPDFGRPHPGAQLGQLALDAHAAPGTVLPCHAHDQLDGLIRQGRSSSCPLGPPLPPPPTRRLPVPTKQRLWLDEEHFPAGSGEQPGQRSQEGMVGRVVTGPAFDLALEDLQLVAKDDDLDLVLHSWANWGSDDQLQHAAANEVDDGTDHARA